MSGFIVDPAAAQAAARACRSQADFLEDILRDANPRIRDRFGDCRIGDALTAKFTDKRGNANIGLAPPLQKACAELRAMAAEFDAAAAGYRLTDHGGGQSIGAVGETC